MTSPAEFLLCRRFFSYNFVNLLCFFINLVGDKFNVSKAEFVCCSPLVDGEEGAFPLALN